MYFTSDNAARKSESLIITVAPYGPQWLPSDYPEDIASNLGRAGCRRRSDCSTPVQRCCTSMSGIRRPVISRRNFNEYRRSIGRLRKGRTEDESYRSEGQYSLAHRRSGKRRIGTVTIRGTCLTEIKSEAGTRSRLLSAATQMDVLPLRPRRTIYKERSSRNPAMQKAYQNMVADATPEFYVEHLKRLRKHQIQPTVPTGPYPPLEAIEHLIRTVGVPHGAVEPHFGGNRRRRGCRPQSFRFHECVVRRSPHGSVASNRVAMADGSRTFRDGVALGMSARSGVGIEDNMWRRKGERMTSVRAGRASSTIAKELGPQGRDRRTKRAKY